MADETAKLTFANDTFNKRVYKDPETGEEVSLAIDPEQVEVGQAIDIAIFREGTWEHPWYGEVAVDEAYLNNIVQNFKNGINSSGISANEDHRGGKAFGWVEESAEGLFVRKLSFNTREGEEVVKSILFGKFVPNELGAKALRGREFRYTSAEVIDDYTTYEVIDKTIETDNGEQNVRSVNNFGPTMVAFAFTNQPFINDMPAIFNNETGQTEQVDYELWQEKDSDLPGKFYSKIYSKPKQIEEVEGLEEVQQEEIQKMNFTEVQAKLKEFSTARERVGYLNGLREGVEDTAMIDMLVEAEKRAEASAAEAAEATKNYSALQTENASLIDERAKLQFNLRKAEEQKYSNKVKAFSLELEQLNIPQAAIKEVEGVLSGMDVDVRTKNFSAKEGQELDLMGALKNIFSKLDFSSKVPEGEDLETNQNVEINPGKEEDVESEDDKVIKAFSAKYKYTEDEIRAQLKAGDTNIETLKANVQ